MSFIELLKKRRSYYFIGKNITESNEDLEKLIKEAIKLSPSSFNSQSSRAVILFDASHVKFWNIVKETLRKIVPPEFFESTGAKLSAFEAGKGTVLFYEDQDIVKNLQNQFESYADNFPVWSEHSSAIAQFAVWTVLAEKNIGASLQHYNPIIDQEVAQTFGVASSWKLRAQLVFGSIEAPAGEKEFMTDEDRFKLFS